MLYAGEDIAASNGKIMGVADFVAGFVFGMTADNHLTEIEACFTGGELMYHEVNTGIQRIKMGGWDNDVQAAFEFGLVALQVPQALHTCESMGDDLAAIKSWASVFTDPASLAKQVGKHYVFHKAEIKSDIAAVEADWSQQLYFKSGAALADLLTLAVGPIEVKTALPPVDSVPDFTAGLIYGFTGNDHRVELEGCMTDTTTIVDDAKTFLGDLKGLHLIEGLEDAGKIVWDLPNALESCEKLGQLQDDVNTMLGWAEILKEPTHAMKVASKNWLFHGVEIKKDIADEEADWAKKDYYSAGQDTAAALLTLIPLSAEDAFLQ